VGLIYLDSCLVIYLAENHPSWAERVRRALSRAGGVQFAISPLVKLECLVDPIKRADSVLERVFSELFDLLVPLAMPEEVYLQAANLRARSGLKTPDALHLACAQHHRCEALWTNDDRLTRVSRGLARNILSKSA
jgi:uncharacterized protein